VHARRSGMNIQEFDDFLVACGAARRTRQQSDLRLPDISTVQYTVVKQLSLLRRCFGGALKPPIALERGIGLIEVG